MPTQHLEPRRKQSLNTVVVGLLVVAFGLVLLAQQWSHGRLVVTSHLWPLVLIGMGLARALSTEPGKDGRPRSRRPGVWLVIVGCWGLVNEFGIAGFTYNTSWPLLVIGMGILLVWRSLEEPPVPSGPPRGDR